MKLALLFTVTAIVVAAPAYATYDEVMSQCQKFAADNNTSPEPCECIANNIGDNEALTQEQAGLKTLDEFNNTASKELKAAVEPCLEE